MNLQKEVLIEYLRNNNIQLIPSHEKLCFPIIERIFRKMSIGLKFSSIRVSDQLIIDGHHRYLASLLASFSLEQTDCIKSSSKTAFKWESIELVDVDWDTEAKIEMLNREDAKYNDMTLEELLKKLKTA
jgi:hypothetical protein